MSGLIQSSSSIGWKVGTGLGPGARRIEGRLGKVSGGNRKSHGGVNRRQARRESVGLGCWGQEWGLVYFLLLQLPPLLLLWGAQKGLHG